MHLPDDHMRYAIIWFSMAGLLLIAFAAWLRGRFRGRVTPPRRAAGPAARARLGKPFVARHVPADRGAPLLRPELLQRERQLVVGDALGFAAEIRAADLGDDRLEPFVADDELVALGDDGGTTCALGQEQRAQRVESSGSVSLTSIVARYVLRVYGARPVRVSVAGSECRPLTAIALAATLIPARQPSVIRFQHWRKISSVLIRDTLVPIGIPAAREAVGERKPGVGYEYHPPGPSKKVRTAVAARFSRSVEPVASLKQGPERESQQIVASGEGKRKTRQVKPAGYRSAPAAG
jgi:hypothetical protein